MVLSVSKTSGSHGSPLVPGFGKAKKQHAKSAPLKSQLPVCDGVSDGKTEAIANSA